MIKSHFAFNSSGLGSGAVAVKDIFVSDIFLPAGEILHWQEDQHVIGLAPPYPTLTPCAIVGSRVVDFRWAPSSIDYLPPGIHVTAAILEATNASYVAIPDRLFRQAAFETIDASKLEMRWMPGQVDTISSSLVRAINDAAHSADINDWPMIAESIVTALAVRMMQNMGAVSRHGAAPYSVGLPAYKIKLVVDYVEANLSRSIRLSELAGVAQLSTFHFARAFRKAMNIAPAHYVAQRRIERAKAALRDLATPLVVVAYACGYSSQSHFSTAFKEATGRTPAGFRAAL